MSPIKVIYIKATFRVSSPPQCWSQAIVCISTTRMYPWSWYFLLKALFELWLAYFTGNFTTQSNYTMDSPPSNLRNVRNSDSILVQRFLNGKIQMILQRFNAATKKLCLVGQLSFNDSTENFRTHLNSSSLLSKYKWFCKVLTAPLKNYLNMYICCYFRCARICRLFWWLWDYSKISNYWLVLLKILEPNFS